MKITRRQLRQIIKESFSGYADERPNNPMERAYARKEQSVDTDGDSTLDADELRDIADEIEGDVASTASSTNRFDNEWKEWAAAASFDKKLIAMYGKDNFTEDEIDQAARDAGYSEEKIKAAREKRVNESQQIKITRKQLRQLIKESPGNIAVHLRQRGQNDRAAYTSGLYEDDDRTGSAEGVVKYTVPWTQNSSPPVITLPDSSTVEFLKVVQDLQGKELFDPDDGGKFVFTLDNFRQSDEDTDAEIAEHMIDVGVSAFYIEQWADIIGGYSSSEDITDY